MNRFSTRLLVLLVALVSLTSCGTITRTEKDVYTITEIDTTVASQVHNQPGDRDNGVIYPSSRTITMDRSMKQRDSVVTREYPGFIRLGVFEGIGLIGSSIDGTTINNGLFGLFPPIDDLLFEDPADENASTLFRGGIYRLGIGEWKLHWFGDEPDWTWGVTAYETIFPDNNHALRGIGVLSIRKRFYLRDKIPYMAITPQLHLAAFPSQYVNAGASADLGSIGGLNLRFYAGYAMGLTNPIDGEFINFPYAGLGVSVMDFLNREEELDVEWKYHEHSAWELGGAEGFLVGAGDVSASFFGRDKTTPDKSALTGFTFRVLHATIALPILDNRLSLGTSLVNAIALGVEEFGIGVLPIRASYHWQPFNNKFIVEPFAEFNYAPSTFTQLGVRAGLPISDQLSLLFIAAYASGNTGSDLGFSLYKNSGVGYDQNFSAFYLGFGASFFDKIFSREELRYGRGLPHE